MKKIIAIVILGMFLLISIIVLPVGGINVEESGKQLNKNSLNHLAIVDHLTLNDINNDPLPTDGEHFVYYYFFPGGIACDSEDNVTVGGAIWKRDIWIEGSSIEWRERPIKLVIIKFDENGNKIWKKTRTITNLNRYCPRDVVVDSSDNIIVAGENVRYPGILTGGVNLFIAKYNKNGDFLWEKKYDKKINDWLTGGAAVDLSDNIILTGSTSGEFMPYYDLKSWIIKCDGDNGAKLKEDIFDEDYDYNFAKGATVNSNNDIIVTGVCSDDVKPKSYIIKYDNNLNRLWNNPVYYDEDYGFGNCAYSVDVDSDGNIVIGGSFYIDNTGYDLDYFVTKFNPSGTKLWSVTYDSNVNPRDWAEKIIVDSSNNIIITGGNDYFGTVKYLPNSDLDWDKIDEETEGMAQYIAVDSSDNIVVAGGHFMNRVNSLVKYDKDGNVLWRKGPIVESINFDQRSSSQSSSQQSTTTTTTTSGQSSTSSQQSQSSQQSAQGSNFQQSSNPLFFQILQRLLNTR